jgi:hypothetical protein
MADRVDWDLWKVEQWQRLNGLHHTDQARDLADIFADDLNRQHAKSLTFVCALDSPHTPTDRKQPDFLYEDRPACLSVVFEVTRLIDRQTKENASQWERFLRCAECHIPATVRGRFLVSVNLSKHPPRNRAACVALANTLSERSGVSEETIDLSDIVPSARAFHYDVAEKDVHLELGPSAHRVDLSFEWYGDVLRETNDKFLDYSSTHETFLLIDSRPVDALRPDSLRRFKPWHWIAWNRTARSRELRSLAPFAITHDDFSNIHHVIAFGVDSGIHAESIWQAPSSSLRTPDGWIIEPPVEPAGPTPPSGTP